MLIMIGQGIFIAGAVLGICLFVATISKLHKEIDRKEEL